jgi:Protein of unknown function (DUF3035)
MRSLKIALSAATAAVLLASCGGSGLNRTRPDEFAVARQQPLVVPPDFTLVPPRAGDPNLATADTRTQAAQALFGGPAPRSAIENEMLRDAGAEGADPGARSVVGDPATPVVDKGTTTQTIIAAPSGSGQEANVTTPQ